MWQEQSIDATHCQVTLLVKMRRQACTIGLKVKYQTQGGRLNGRGYRLTLTAANSVKKMLAHGTTHRTFASVSKKHRDVPNAQEVDQCQRTQLDSSSYRAHRIVNSRRTVGLHGDH